MPSGYRQQGILRPARLGKGRLLFYLAVSTEFVAHNSPTDQATSIAYTSLTKNLIGLSLAGAAIVYATIFRYFQTITVAIDSMIYLCTYLIR